MAAVQFDHRLLAEFVLLALVVVWLYARKFELAGRARTAMNLLLLFGFVQFLLGVATLLMAVPVPLGVAHQGGAMLLFATALFATPSRNCTKSI